ncbi:hypothetical protein PENSPDRAFT_650589 [Peniophora sp. CONT]|nr:hypothetical protein PENSPDRAFT_650589 [Peniophora sp. CONT]
MAVLHDLSPELVDAILLFIPPRQLLDIRLCSRWFDGFITRSSLAQYRVECWAAGVYDDLRPGLSYPERLEVLRNREEAWHTLDIRKRYDIPVPFLTSRTFDFTEGVYALTDTHSGQAGMQAQGQQQQQQQQQQQALPEGYATLRLPTMESEESEMEAGQGWKRVALPDNFVEYALSVHEHDLVAALTSKRIIEAPPAAAPDQDMQMAMHSFDLHFRTVSSGDYHPSAQKPVVRICNEFPVALKPRAFVMVAGEYVVVMLAHQDLPTLTPSDRDILYFVHWRSGVVHEVANFTPREYQGFVFLREDVMLFCNIRTTALDIYGIQCGADASTTPSLVEWCSLRLPFPGGLTGYQCRAEPNVVFPNTGVQVNPPPRERPFRDDPECALVLFYFYFTALSCTLFVHRHKLLAAVLQGAEDNQRLVKYERWGRNICAWMSDGGSYITQAHGQRWVTTSPVWNPEAENDMDEMLSMIQVHDFNPHTVRRALRELGPEGKKVLPNGNLVEVCPATWVHMVQMPQMNLETRLPYVAISLPDLVNYDDVMLDDERILGLYPSADGQGMILTGVEVLKIA